MRMSRLIEKKSSLHMERIQNWQSALYPLPIEHWRLGNNLSMELHGLPKVVDAKALIETDKSIIILGECTSIMEKIYSSPVPLVYTRHTARFLSLWALLLPAALYSSFVDMAQPFLVLPASAILAFFLFGVDELAMQLEEPFSILPMKSFCDQILGSVDVLAGGGGGSRGDEK